MQSEYFNGRRVLVTGADGFLGSHVVERLLELGARVTAFTRSTSTHGTSQITLRNLAHVASELEAVIAANIASPETTRIIQDAEPEVILHLAAEAYVPRSFEQPEQVFAANATGTLYVLEAARRLSKLLRVVVTSSSEIYGSALFERAIDETHPLNPTSPYAASKVAADRLAYSYRVTFGLPVAVIRPFNFYGPRHTYDVIPKFIRLALEGRDLTVYGDGEQRRDFTYVEDTVRGFLVMASHPAAVGEAVNFGSGRSYSIKHTAERIVALTGTNSRIVFDAARLAEVNHLLCDASRAWRLFGWKAEIDFDEGLRRNIEWERKRRTSQAP
jgi:nucleoside-diphosphate-sugar epimerase